MNTLKKPAAAAALLVALGATAACGDDSNAADTDSTGTVSQSPTQMPSDTMDEGMTDAGSGLVGSGCAAYAEAVPSGAGSVEGMAQDPVAVAASNNPLLKTLTAAVSGQLNKKVNLVDTLNGGEFTVFAPVDDAFAKLPAKTVKALSKPKGAETLTQVLTYHVVPGQIAPADIAGTQETVQGGTVEVTGSGDDLKVNDASVICGGVKTANATVYLIDTVLQPTM